jgi:hypothetical protein
VELAAAACPFNSKARTGVCRSGIARNPSLQIVDMLSTILTMLDEERLQ